MELSYGSSDWVGDDDGHQSPKLILSRPKSKRLCQVPGCTADLEAVGKPYCIVKRICPIHMKADIIPVRNQVMRFCQQCGVLEPLSLFDVTKRSCRDSLSRRVKHPVEIETRPKRKRKTLHDRDAGSNSRYGPSSFAYTAMGAADAAVLNCGLPEMNWDAAFMAAAGPLLDKSAAITGHATAWGINAADVMVPNSCWCELPAAAAAGAAAATACGGGSPAALASPALSSCTAAASAAAAAAAAPLLTSSGGAAVTVATGGFGCSAQGSASTLQTAMQQQQLQLLQPMSLPAAAGVNSPLSGSNGSSAVLDPAVAELEEFMMQELAAAGMTVLDSSSAAALPALHAAPIHAPALQQPMWQRTPTSQQQQAAGVDTVMQFHGRQPMQLQQPIQQLMQQPVQQQTLGTSAPTHHWRNPAAAPTPALNVAACYASSPGPSAATGVWVPAGACGSNMSSPNAAIAPQLEQQQQQQGVLHASGVAAAGRCISSRSEMMARLQGRLRVLQSQMEDMQLMLGLLQDG